MKAEMIKYLNQKIMLKSVVVSLSLLFTGSNLYPQLIMDDVPELRGIDIEEHLGEYVSPDLWFINSKGERKQLGDYFNQGKPIFLMLAYYECPMLCGMILNGVSRMIRAMPFDVGNEYNIVTFSIDPEETVDMAKAKQEGYMKKYGREGAEKGWHFLTGDQAAITKLTDALGFYYKLDPDTGDYAHASGVMLLTPKGIVSKYFYGIEYSARDMRWAIIDASKNKIGTLVDRVLMFCFHFVFLCF